MATTYFTLQVWEKSNDTTAGTLITWSLYYNVTLTFPYNKPEKILNTPSWEMQITTHLQQQRDFSLWHMLSGQCQNKTRAAENEFIFPGQGAHFWVLRLNCMTTVWLWVPFFLRTVFKKSLYLFNRESDHSWRPYDFSISGPGWPDEQRLWSSVLPPSSCQPNPQPKEAPSQRLQSTWGSVPLKP